LLIWKYLCSISNTVVAHHSSLFFQNKPLRSSSLCPCPAFVFERPVSVPATEIEDGKRLQMREEDISSLTRKMGCLSKQLLHQIVDAQARTVIPPAENSVHLCSCMNPNRRSDVDTRDTTSAICPLRRH
jgi:hypothetical protein